MKVSTIYQQWLQSPHIDEATKAELRTIADQPSEIEDRFYKKLEFGTGGMRGILGAGTNRVNRYTFGKATQGLATYIASLGDIAKERGVVIAYDSRHQSAELAVEVACTLVANGINAYVFESLRPTPELSFAVRKLETQAGIVITASHNPPEYNGYKVYGDDGAQLVADIAEQVVTAINEVQDLADIRTMTRAEAEQSGKLRWIGAEIDDEYTARLKELSLHNSGNNALSVVYTPLHGAGNQMVQRILRENGFTQLHVVPEQEQPDPDFSTVRSPNPEERDAFALAISLAEEKHADLIVGTDPDCDRVGVVVRNAEGQFEVLSGNQVGVLLLHYLLSEKGNQLAQGATMIKTIVTSPMGTAIAERYGVETLNTLTGFKYIAEHIRSFETSDERQFVFGYEESNGYLAATFVREKDGVMATMQVCEMAAYYKTQGKSLYALLDELYQEYGYFVEGLESRTLKGKDGLARIQAIMSMWRSEPLTTVGSRVVTEVTDYLEETPLPKENALFYALEGGSWFCLRPSGTEPKIKVYFGVKETSKADALESLAEMKQVVMARIDSV